MVSDDERHEVARMAELNAAADAQFWKYNIARVMGMNGRESDASMWHRFADLIDPDTASNGLEDSLISPISSPMYAPDAKAMCDGWTVEVYDPDGVLVSPSLTAQDIVGMIVSAELARDLMLKIADDMEDAASDWDITQNDVPFVHAGRLLGYAERIRNEIGRDE